MLFLWYGTFHSVHFLISLFRSRILIWFLISSIHWCILLIHHIASLSFCLLPRDLRPNIFAANVEIEWMTLFVPVMLIVFISVRTSLTFLTKSVSFLLLKLFESTRVSFFSRCHYYNDFLKHTFLLLCSFHYLVEFNICPIYLCFIYGRTIIYTFHKLIDPLSI